MSLAPSSCKGGPFVGEGGDVSKYLQCGLDCNRRIAQATSCVNRPPSKKAVCGLLRLVGAASAMEQTPVCLSPELLAANERLLQLRSLAHANLENGQRQQLADIPPGGERSAPACFSAVATKANRQSLDRLPFTADQPGGDISDLINSLPDHLGWGSQPLTHLLRQSPKQMSTAPLAAPPAAMPANSKQPHARHDQATNSTNSRPSPISHVKLYPDIGLAMLREEQTASGRIWLLLRGLDEDGRGWVGRSAVRRLLTKRKSSLYLCGWRQLRNLLRDGEGLYWQQDHERIWLRSAAKVALALGVNRLTGRPVLVEVSSLRQGIGRFRAELYTAFHSGRAKDAPSGQGAAAPIARETLTAISGVGESTQRRYEAKTGTDVQTNYAIGNTVTETEMQESAWQNGHAIFVLKDTRGQQGPKGRQYIAWQLPNSYSGSHQQCPKGRQRRINRQLTQMRENDLVMKGMPGNVEPTTETTRAKLYYPTGKLAAQAFNRGQVDRCYWQQSKPKKDLPTMNSHAIWQHLEVGPC